MMTVILMKKINNEYFIKFCEVIKRSLYDPSKYNECLSDMVNSSLDDANQVKVYTEKDNNIQVIRLDEYTKDFEEKRRRELQISHQPAAVDAVCVNKDNEWFLIEFKNQPLESVLSSKSTSRKMLSSIWLIAYLYSMLSEKMSSETDILKFARENVTFIVVVSSEKNETEEETIGATWERDGSFYTPEKFKRYIGYYFKDVYTLTEKGLKFFIRSFDT